MLSEEQTVGGKFEADVDLYTDFSKASLKDELSETIDYHKVYKFIFRIALEEKHYLIESLATKIANELLLNFEKLQKVCVRVRKIVRLSVGLWIV